MRRWVSFITVLLVTFGSTFAFVPERSRHTNMLPFEVVDVTKTENGIDLTLEYEQPSWYEVGDNNSAVLVTEYSSGGVVEIDEYPVVPIIGGLFRIPSNSGVSVEIIDAEYEVFDEIEYAHYAGVDDPHSFISAVSAQDTWFPGTIADIGEPAVFRDFRVTNLVTYPVQVNSARQEVRVYHNIQVAISFEGTDDRNQYDSWPTHISESFLPFYRQLLDWDENELDEYTLYRGSVQLIARNNMLQLDETQEWIEWKLQKGWEFEYITPQNTPDFTAAGIKSELQTRWDNAELKYDYVLVIGDSDGTYDVPPGSGYGDHEYCRLEGGDQLIECMHGRISLETIQQAATYFSKVFAYERNPDLNNTDWYLKGTLTANSATSGMSTVYLSRYARDAMIALGFTDANVYAYNDGGGDVNSRAIDDLNGGISFYGHRGYLSTGLDADEINGLSNDYMTPIVLDVTCSTGDWTGWGEGRNETWMRAGEVNAPSGSIAAMGTHTAGTNTRCNNALSGGAWYSMLVQRNPTIGHALFAAKFNLFQNFNGFSDMNVTSFSEWCNMMGDPLAYVWTGIPIELDVTAEAAVELGDNSYEVIALDSDTGDPVEGAWVTLYKMSNDDDLIVRGETDSQGYVELIAPFEDTGDAVLTVSQQHYAPYQLEIDVVAPDDRVGYLDISFLDDGTEGTSGNGNEIPEAGETVGLVITAKNFGTSQQTNVEATATSDDVAIVDVNGTADFGTINAGQSGVNDTPILVEIDPEARHDWIAHLELEFSSNQGTYEDGCVIAVRAAKFAFETMNITGGGIDPGETQNITVNIRNIGGSDATGESSVELVSNDPQLVVDNGDGSVNGLNIGNTATTTEFPITAHSMTFPGHMANTMLIITTALSQVDTVHFSIPIGTRTSSDPSGPDGYGYYAYDNTDIDYENLYLEYDWIEINPNAPDNDFEGTNQNLSDTGDNVDDSVVLELPFTVQYYGVEFDSVTLSANGFIAMGSQPDQVLPRNWIIPSPLGPDYMIAPYWDERRTSGSDNVYTYYDEDGGRFIVEWYQVDDAFNGNPCTFEVIIYDMVAGHGTLTGDNEIHFQYNEVSHSQGDWSDVPYFTTGIENGDQSDGLLISYWGTEYPGAAPVENGRSIVFTTNTTRATGFLEGTVTDLNTDEAIEGVEVGLLESRATATTDVNGFYLMEVMVGTYTVVADHEPYEYYQQGGVTVDSAETTVFNFGLGSGLFHVSPETLNVTLYDEIPQDHIITLSNMGTAPIEVHLELTPSFELDDSMDVVQDLDITQITGDSWIGGMVYGDDVFYLSGANGNLNPNYVYRLGFNGEFLGSFEQPGSNVPGANIQGFQDLAYDGDFLYGSIENQVYAMNPNTGQVLHQFTGPYQPNQAMCYDPVYDALWIGRNTQDIVAVDKETGEEINRIESELYIDALTYWPNQPDGFTLYMSARENHAGVRRDIYRANPELDSIEYVTQFETLEGYETKIKGLALIPAYNTYYNALALLHTTNDEAFLYVHELNMQIPYATFSPDAVFLFPDEDQDVTVTLSSAGLDDGLYRSDLTAYHTTPEAVTVIPILLTLDLLAVQAATAEIPKDFALNQPYPNPFNNTTTISFDVPDKTEISLAVYDVLGRQVALLEKSSFEAGSYNVAFDGSKLASGIYFITFNAGSHYSQVRKMVLLK